MPRSKRDRPHTQFTLDEYLEPVSKKKKASDNDYVPDELSDPEDHVMDLDVVPEASPAPQPGPSTERQASKSKSNATKSKAPVTKAVKRKKVNTPALISPYALRILMDHSAQRRSRTPGSDTSGTTSANTSMETTGVAIDTASSAEDNIIYISD